MENKFKDTWKISFIFHRKYPSDSSTIINRRHKPLYPKFSGCTNWSPHV